MLIGSAIVPEATHFTGVILGHLVGSRGAGIDESLLYDRQKFIYEAEKRQKQARRASSPFRRNVNDLE